METTPKSRPWYVVLPILLLLMMGMVHSWRTFVLSQTKLLFLPPQAYSWALREQGVKAEDLPESDPGEEQKRVRALSAAHPQDYQIQLAYALMAEWSHALNSPDDRVKRLDALAGEFPKDAKLYAHMLRYETEKSVRVRRQSEYEYIVLETDKDDIKADPDELRPPPDVKKRQEEFERYAVAGEKLEPDNAYFSMMRAVGLFSSAREKYREGTQQAIIDGADLDAQAIDCIKAASKKTRYEDHVADELKAEWKLANEAFGDHSAALRAAIQGGVGSPHLAQLVSAGRTAATIAVKLELDATTNHDEQKFAQAIDLRVAMAHCGALMRAQSHSLPSAIAGCDIAYQQIARPGGAHNLAEDVNFSKAERENQRLDACFNYMIKHNKGDEVEWLRKELKTEADVREIRKAVADASPSPFGQHGLKVASWWMVDCTLLAAIFYLVVPMVAVALITAKKNSKPSSLMLILTGCFALGLALAWQAQWAAAMMAMRAQFMNWILHNGGTGAQSRLSSIIDKVFDPGNLHVIVVLFAIALPALVMALVYRNSRKNDIVYIDTIKLDFVPIAAMIACVTILAYCVALTMTARNDVQLNLELDQVMENEGKFLAPMVGREWPG